MSDVVGIRFKNCGKIYDFEVNGLEVAKGDAVVVESELGLSLGRVVIEKRELAEATKELKKVMRKATEDDIKQKEENKFFSEEAMAFCIERVMARGLPMKMICTEATLDRKRFIFYFTADGRIDFRELVKDLAAKFKTRIEMRQVGVRDASKIVGGFGICGREFCCKTFLISFEPISIRMAKSQELVLNASKLSGVCGRLMCCLGYEYSEGEKNAPGAHDKEETPASEDAGEVTTVFLEEPFSPVREEITEPSGDRGGRQSPEDTLPRSTAAEVETRSYIEQVSVEPSEKAEQGSAPKGDGCVASLPAEASGGKKGHGKRFRRRRRHERRFKK